MEWRSGGNSNTVFGYKLFHLVINYFIRCFFYFQSAAETIRENTIEIWKDIERHERRYRFEAIGLETKVLQKLFHIALFLFHFCVPVSML